jgi:hypothetical protein
MVYHVLFLSILMSVYTTSYFPKERVYTVEWAGKLSDLYINNNFTAKANLDTMQSKPSLYGFGIAENGEGEILILNRIFRMNKINMITLNPFKSRG